MGFSIVIFAGKGVSAIRDSFSTIFGIWVFLITGIPLFYAGFVWSDPSLPESDRMQLRILAAVLGFFILIPVLAAIGFSIERHNANPMFLASILVLWYCLLPLGNFIGKRYRAHRVENLPD